MIKSLNRYTASYLEDRGVYSIHAIVATDNSQIYKYNIEPICIISIILKPTINGIQLNNKYRSQISKTWAVYTVYSTIITFRYRNV